jgi:hypothetical protein
VSAITVDFIPNWSTRLKTRLYTQFRNKDTWNAFCDLLGRQFDDLEASGQSLFSLLDIDNSAGVELDAIGRIVGQPRLGADDATYRLYLRARIISNDSTGSSEDIYKVMRALFETTAVGITAALSTFSDFDTLLVVADVASLPNPASVAVDTLVVVESTSTIFITYDRVSWTALS